MSSAKLDEVLSAQKPSSDTIGLGYDVSSGPSTSTAFGSRTIFMPQFEKGHKGMKSKTDLANSKSFVRPHVCHHCEVSGHICPNWFKLYPHKQLSKQSQVSSQGPTPLFGELLKTLSFLTQFQKNFNSSCPSVDILGHVPFHLHGQRLVLCGWERSLRINCLFYCLLF